MKFEIAKGFENKDINLPVRSTKGSAGYDFEAAEDIIIPSIFTVMENYQGMITDIVEENIDEIVEKFDLDSDIALPPNEMQELINYQTEKLKEFEYYKKSPKEFLPKLVKTGIKCKLEDGYYLELVNRSSGSFKRGLILANGIGIIDADYYGNESNDGHIMFQFLNITPFPIIIKKGERIGQGIIKKYYTVENEENIENVRGGGFGSTN